MLKSFKRPIARASANVHEKLLGAIQRILYRLLLNDRIECWCDEDIIVNIVNNVPITVGLELRPSSVVLQHGDGAHGPQHTHTPDKTNCKLASSVLELVPASIDISNAHNLT